MEGHDESLGKKQEEEKSLEPKPADSPSRNKFFDWCNQYGAGITALATVALFFGTFGLAVLTYLYLGETRKQRELVYTQVVLANSPDVSIVTPAPFRYGNMMKTHIDFRNGGGPTGEAKYDIVLICCNQFGELMNNIENTETLRWPGRFAHMSANFTYRVSMGIDKKVRNKFEEASKSENINALIFAFAQITYIKPPLQIQDKPINIIETQSFWWNPEFTEWIYLSKDQHETIKSFLDAKGVLKEPPLR